MPVARTKTEAAANEIDMDLYRLICAAERLSDELQGRKQARAKALDALRNMRAARYGLRGLMAKADLEATA